MVVETANPMLEEYLAATGGRLCRGSLFESGGWEEAPGDFRTRYELRDHLRKQYGFAIPNEQALDLLVSLSPIIEIGAGTGYWAYLLQQRGADVLAYDRKPPREGKNWYGMAREWVAVEKANAKQALVGGHADRTLFLCWPPYDDPMADTALRLYQGDGVVYVGEDEGGCNATGTFFRRLERWGDLVRTVDLPQWPGIHDDLFYWRRKGA